MSQPYNNTQRISNRQSTESTNNSSTPSVSSPGGDEEVDCTVTPTKSDSKFFIGKDQLLQQFRQQLKQFEEWYERHDWLAFHHHHYDWWMFPIDEISSRGSTYRLPVDVLNDLRRDKEFILQLRQGVRMMVSSWGWDIENGKLFDTRDDKQKWSYWPVRLYKAGKCMWLFNQNDYYQSLRKFAYYVKDKEGEKLDYFSHTKNGKADVFEQWDQMEQPRFS